MSVARAQAAMQNSIAIQAHRPKTVICFYGYGENIAGLDLAPGGGVGGFSIQGQDDPNVNPIVSYPSQMFAGASNFEMKNPIFTTGNVTYHGAPQAANHGHASISVSNVLLCPPPSKYFVGREDTLEKLSKIFSAPVVTVWSTNIDVLKDFVRHRLKYSSIFLDASSSQALDKSIAENITQVTSGNTLLVLQNPSAPVEEYLDRLPYAPVLAITTQSSGESSTAFQFPDYASQQEVNQLLHSIENALDPGQQVVTLIANGRNLGEKTTNQFPFKFVVQEFLPQVRKSTFGVSQ
ncbi:hypothetical protein BT96DRAFT_1026627 [Gymnopus androsaceus JB14]|uniref:Uncharacterized protein n=1 Tax=Gymnopus androsaceus JB14 TaxID=1447944 RepID=A0A6A4GI41_9AGAR|nr:hypothetical protein BT96DRAFT_1026627 [Gymnopus androsaceus JB14]